MSVEVRRRLVTDDEATHHQRSSCPEVIDRGNKGIN